MATDPQSRLPLVPLAAGVVVASCVGAAGAMAAASAAAWTSGREAGLAAGVALACVLVACVAGSLVVSLVAGGDARRVAPGVVAAGVVRMIASLGLGLTLFLVIKPDGRTFWTAFLVSNLLCLAVETAWGMLVNQRVHAARGGTPVGGVIR